MGDLGHLHPVGQVIGLLSQAGIVGYMIYQAAEIAKVIIKVRSEKKSEG